MVSDKDLYPKRAYSPSRYFFLLLKSVPVSNLFESLMYIHMINIVFCSFLNIYTPIALTGYMWIKSIFFLDIITFFVTYRSKCLSLLFNSQCSYSINCSSEISTHLSRSRFDQRCTQVCFPLKRQIFHLYQAPRYRRCLASACWWLWRACGHT